MDNLVEILLGVASAATTLFAAYYGAKYAFEFQNSQQEKIRAEDDVRNANVAILSLLAAHNHLTRYRAQVVEPKINDPYRHFSILPISVKLPKVVVELDKLSFLVKSSNPSIIHGISLSAIDINFTVDLIDVRSQFHFNELQPRMEAIESDVGNAISLQQMEPLLGQRTTQNMKYLTDMMIAYLDNSLSVIETAIRKLHLATKEVYPDHLVAKMTEQPHDEQP